MEGKISRRESMGEVMLPVRFYKGRMGQMLDSCASFCYLLIYFILSD